MADSRYSTITIVVHWLTAAAVTLAVALGWRMADAGGSERESTLAWHMSTGIAILLLTLLRMSWRVMRQQPALPPGPVWEQRAAALTHKTFYVALIVIPLLGWLTISTSPFASTIFGFIPLPAIPGVEGSSGLGAFAANAHRILAYCLCLVVLLHMAAALKHHLYDPSSGLARILPGTRRVFDWRVASVAAALVLLFILGKGYADAVLPRALHLVRVDVDSGRTLIDPRRAHVFGGVMLPIFDEKCAGCHGERSQKGGLRLDSFAAVSEGGEGGNVVVPGKADESELIRRIMMPSSHKDAMPPAGKPALTPAEGQLMLWWIAAGADDSTTIAAANPPPLVQRILQEVGVSSESPVFAKPVAPPDSATLAELRKAFQIQFVYSGGGFLRAQPRFDRDGSQPLRVDALAPVAEQLVWLDLSGSNLPEGQLAGLSRLRKLQRLNLAGTQVSDAAIQHIQDLPYLEILNLYGTRVTDATLVSLTRMPALTSVYLSGTAVTAAAVERFRKSHPATSVVWEPEKPQA